MAISYRTYMQGGLAASSINATVDTTTTLLYPLLVSAPGTMQNVKISHASSNLFAWNALTGALTVTGNIGATNLSGTNTGDQTSVSGSSGSCTGNAFRARGITRSDSAEDTYNVKSNWNTPVAGYWNLRGFNTDTFHAEVAVGYASSAGTATTCSGNAATATLASTLSISTNRTDSTFYQAMWTTSGGTTGYSSAASGISIRSSGYGAIGFNSAGWYLEGNGTYGLYSNTGLNAAGGLWDNANRVFSNNNPVCATWFTFNSNYGHSVEGLYNSTIFQGLYGMGAAYRLGAGGTVGNLYGMTWSYPSAGGAAGNLASHGFIVLINGGFASSMSSNIVASGNITAYSDDRLKENWQPMPDNYLQKLAKVKVGIYDRIDLHETQVGVSAQSLEPVLPPAVTTSNDDMKTKHVSYGNAALASAVMLAQETVELRKLIVALQEKVTKLEEKLDGTH